MGGLFSSGNSAKQATAAGALQVQTSARGGVKPLVYGTTRVAAIVLDYDDFLSFQVNAQNASKGKGGGGGKSGKTQAKVTEYSASFILGFCQGPIVAFGQWWYDKYVTTVANIGSNGQVAPDSINLGGDGQAPDPHWAASFPSKAIGYSGTANIAFANYILGPSPTLPNFSAEVIGLLTTTGPNGMDCSPDQMVKDFLTNSRYGAYFPIANLDSNTFNSSINGTYAQYVQAMGLWSSIALETHQEAQQTLDMFTKLTNSEVVWSGGVLKIIPRGEQTVTGQITQNASWTITLAGGDAQAGDFYEVTISDPKLGTQNVQYGAFQNESITNVGQQIAGMLYSVIEQFDIVIVNVTQAESPAPPTPTAQNNIGIFRISMFQNPPTGMTAVTVTAASAGGGISVATNFAGGVGTYVPNTTPIYSLLENDFIIQESSVGIALGPNPGGDALRTGASPITGGFTDDPIHVTRTSPADAYNRLTLEILDRGAWYAPAPIQVFDQAYIDAYGLREETSVNGRMFVDPYTGYVAANLLLRRGLDYRNTYTFQLGWKYILLEPMDLVQITDSRLSMNALTVRLTSIVEDDEGLLSCTAEDWFGVAGTVLYPTPGYVPQLNPTVLGTGGGIVPTINIQLNSNVKVVNFGAQVGNVNAPIIFEPTSPLLTSPNALEIWIALSSAYPNWGGADIWMSFDGNSYAAVGSVSGSSVMGVTTAPLANFTGSNPDAGDTLSVNLTESNGSLSSQVVNTAENFLSLCYVGGELLSYQTAQLVSSNNYNLTILYRGGFGTTISSHISGSAFVAIFAGSIARIPFPSSAIGSTVYFKFTSVNSVGGGAQQLSSVTAYPYVITGAGVATLTISINGSEAGKPGAGAVLQTFVFSASYTFPIGMEGSFGTAGTAATSSVSFSIAHNGTGFATMNFAGGAKVATFTATAPVTFAGGDVLTVLAPATQDATLANVGWTFIAKN